MISPFHLVAHKATFLADVTNFQRNHPEAWGSFATQCAKACNDPYNTGGRLQGLPPHLAGKVRKVWVKGRRGFRFIYFLDADRELIVGVTLSSESRGSFDYDDPVWMDRAELIYQDLVEGRAEAFITLRLAE